MVMKIYGLLMLPFVVLSCKKGTPVSDTSPKDSVTAGREVAAQTVSDSVHGIKRDSVASQVPATQDITRADDMRIEKDRTIVRMADGRHLPITIDEEFTEKQDKLILKITHFNASGITAKIITGQQDFNIRFNQIRLPDGKMDGPFMREITYEVPTSGEVWLTVGKNNMADGKTTGRFSVRVE